MREDVGVGVMTINNMSEVLEALDQFYQYRDLDAESPEKASLGDEILQYVMANPDECTEDATNLLFLYTNAVLSEHEGLANHLMNEYAHLIDPDGSIRNQQDLAVLNLRRMLMIPLIIFI